MKFFKEVFNKSKSNSDKTYRDTDIAAVVSGEMIPAGKIQDIMFAEEMMGQTIAFEPSNGTIVSPANGTLESVFDTGHAFSVRMKDGTGLLVHIGINTVELKGKGFQILKKSGASVLAGQPIVKVNLDTVKRAGKLATTMLIIAEPADPEQKVEYIDFGNVLCGQKINK